MGCQPSLVVGTGTVASWGFLVGVVSRGVTASSCLREAVITERITATIKLETQQGGLFTVILKCALTRGFAGRRAVCE